MIRGLIGALALALSLTPGTVQAADRPIPIPIPVETFADTPFLSRPVLSPDGTRIAAFAAADDKNRLLVFPADKDAGRQVVELGEATLSDIQWAGNERVLVTVTTNMDWYGTPIPIWRLFAVELAAGTVKMLDPKSRGIMAGDILHVDPDGGWLLVASQDDVLSTPSVKRIELATGKVTKIEKERPNVWNWFADQSGVVRAGISYDADRWTMWYRATAEEPLKPIRRKEKPSGDDGAVDGVRFMSSADDGIILTNARTGRFGAYAYNFRTGTIGAAIYENPEVDITSVVVDPRSGVINGISYTDDRFRISWLDAGKRVLQTKLDRALKNAENIVLNGSRDGNRLLVWSGSGADPGAYYVYDRAENKMFPVAKPYDKLADVTLAPVAPVKYAARDGLSIPGYLTLPLGREAKDLPLIVMPHGGPHARDTWDYDPYVQFLASRGYAVLQPNFRGSTGYGKDYVEKGYGQWGRAMQDDVDDGVDWLIKTGKVDAKRVCIMGISYGGYAAMWGAIRNPERYRCAVSLAGVMDVPGMLRFDRRSFSAPRYFKAWQAKVEGAEKQDLNAVSPLAQSTRLTIPVFIAHGEKDDNVPAKQSHQMIAALKKRGVAADAAFYPTAKHGLQKREDIIDFLKRLEAFLAKHNPA
ncbi:MAG: S9 family peptidase [Pseudomonadota bacterium]|uniref:alpha/beta hydrolase family protein n=1 Tax=Sphingomonas sp. ERG5 TaxID=1381597 RepID=UPI00054B2F97|nr:S9 family peptidase [Sphingomonas sp. ERG5]